MKTAVILFLFTAAVSYAQDRKPEAQPNSEAKRLGSVTWDLKSHKLVWVVEKGTVENGKFKTTSSDKYEITPGDAVMVYADERRGFTTEEAAALQKLLDTLSLYCVESVIWWDQGQGQKLDGKPGEKNEVHKPQKSQPAMPKRTTAALATDETVAKLGDAILHTLQ